VRSARSRTIPGIRRDSRASNMAWKLEMAAASHAPGTSLATPGWSRRLVPRASRQFSLACSLPPKERRTCRGGFHLGHARIPALLHLVFEMEAQLLIQLRSMALRRNSARRRKRKTVSMVRPQAPGTRAASHKGFEFSLAGGRGTTSNLCGMTGRVILGRN
jgi:hypothetical protein